MSSQPKDTRDVWATQCYIGTPADANAQDHYYADSDGRDADADAQSASSSAEQPVSKNLRIRLSALADDDVGASDAIAYSAVRRMISIV